MQSLCSTGGRPKDGSAGTGQDQDGRRWPCSRSGGRLRLGQQLTMSGEGAPCMSAVVIEELNDTTLGREPPQIAQRRLKVVRSPDMFVSPFCCS